MTRTVKPADVDAQALALTVRPEQPKSRLLTFSAFYNKILGKYYSAGMDSLHSKL